MSYDIFLKRSGKPYELNNKVERKRRSWTGHASKMEDGRH
jgi:hypothetical protein